MHAVVYGGGSVVVDSMFIAASVVCGSFVFGHCFIQYFMSLICLQSFNREERE